MRVARRVIGDTAVDAAVAWLRRVRGQLRRGLEGLDGRSLASSSESGVVVARPSADGSGSHGLWPALPPKGYLGQLDPAFQQRLAAQRADVELGDCDFYHTSVLSNGRVVDGPWDLRGRELTYLGGVDLRGERVLEIGPASGHLTFWMERQGADVVAFDVGWDVKADLIPAFQFNQEVQYRMQFDYVWSVQNAWWYLHHDRGSGAKLVHGNIYSLPGDLGTFDTSVFAAVLEHVRDPFAALAEAAARTQRRIVVTEARMSPQLEPDDTLMRFAPYATPPFGAHTLAVWWTLTPGSIRRMLSILGFSKASVTYHSQKMHPAGDLARSAVNSDMFTVVAERG